MPSTDSNRTSVALIGVGMVGSTYASALESLSGEVVLRGVMASRPESARQFLQTYPALGSAPVAEGAVAVYTDVEAIAGDPAVDVVILTTPPNARKELVEVLADAGKPILMEKPLERNLAAAVELVEICERRDVALGVVLQHRVRPSARQLADLIAQNRTGELRAVEISVPWWRDQGYYDEPGRGSYTRDGGGVLISQAIHTLDLALQFTPGVRNLTAFCATSDFHQMESEDFVSAGLRFDNGALGTLFASTACYPGRTESIFLHFEHASIRLESSLLEVHWRTGETQQLGEVSASGSGADPMAFTSDWHATVIREFCEAVRNTQSPPIPARSALRVHALIGALEESARNGCPVEVVSL